MKDHNIGFIGGGNMARSLAGGLINNRWDREKIYISDPDTQKCDILRQLLGVRCSASNTEVAAQVDVLVLAVKPQVLKDVAQEIAATVQKGRPLVISIAAGIRADDLERWLGGDLPVVRVMPNTPALVGSGASGLFANALANTAQRDEAESILRTVGVTVWFDKEPQLDLVTALSGSGPAYFLFFMEGLERAAIDSGLAPETARLLTLETAYGTAKLALESQNDPGVLRERVTSPGGTTEKALEVLEKGDLHGLLRETLDAATQRSRELADMLGKD